MPCRSKQILSLGILEWPDRAMEKIMISLRDAIQIYKIHGKYIGSIIRIRTTAITAAMHTLKFM
jgi:hypothetical protein